MTTIVGQGGPPISDTDALWLLEAVDEWRVRSEKPRHDPGWFHASSLGRTDEELIADFRGQLTYERRTAREYRVFDNGKSRDGDWKRYLADAGLSVVGEEEARRIRIPYLRLCGELDDIAHNPDTGEWWVVEFKTINPYGYSQLTEAKPEHVLQVTAYMAATGIPRSIVLYESKGDQSVRAFCVPFDQVRWEEIRLRLLRLRREAELEDQQHDPKVLTLARRLNDELAK